MFFGQFRKELQQSRRSGCFICICVCLRRGHEKYKGACSLAISQVTGKRVQAGPAAENKEAPSVSWLCEWVCEMRSVLTAALDENSGMRTWRPRAEFRINSQRRRTLARDCGHMGKTCPCGGLWPVAGSTLGPRQLDMDYMSLPMRRAEPSRTGAGP